MTAAEKAQRLQDMAEHPYSYNMSNGDAEIAAEAAAHFRALVPDANGLLPCPMCGARALVMREQHKGMTWYRIQCDECALITARKYVMPDAVAAWNRRGGIAAVVKPPSGQHVLGYIDFLEAWVVVHCDDAGMWRCAWDGEQLCDDVTYWQELPADPERKSRKMTMPEDRHTAEDRDDVAREQRRERREREEYLEDERDTYNTED